MWQQTELGSKVSKLSRGAKESIGTATKRFEGEMEDQMRRIGMKDRVGRMSESIRKMKEKMKNLYREKLKSKLEGIYEGASTSSRKFSGKLKSKMGRFSERMKEFYDERKVGPTTSYSCIGHQMSNFVLSSVLLQHVAFTVLLWRHWDKSDASNFESSTLKLGLLAIVALYWIFAFTSMLTKSIPQWMLYMAMSLILVHMAPFQIVAFDFLLLLLTIGLATISVFDIYHRLYKKSLIAQRSLLQDHLMMAFQVTFLFLHLSSPKLVMILTTLVTILTWKDFVSFFHLQPGGSFFNQAKELLSSQTPKWLLIILSNAAWLSIVNVSTHLLPFSLLHPHLHLFSLSNLAFLAAQLSILHCAILIKYQIRYPNPESPNHQNHSNPRQENNNDDHNHGNIPGQPQNLPPIPQIQVNNDVDDDDNDNDDGAVLAPLLPPVVPMNGQQQIPPPPPLPPRWMQPIQQPNQQGQLQQGQLQVQGQMQAQVQVQGEEHGALSSSANDCEVTSMAVLHPTVYWHYVWILGVCCDFLMGLLDRFGLDGLSQSLSLVLPIIVLVAVLPIQIHYWNNKWNYDLTPCSVGPHRHVHS